MIQLDLPRPEAIDVDLKPEVFLGGTPAVGGNRASFGGPDITAITAASLQNDPDLLSFATSSGFDYYLLAMTLSLAAAPGARIHNSTVAISLTSEPDAAIAWSMNPLRLDGPPVTTKTGGSIEVGLGPMLKIGAERSIETATSDAYLYALGELESDPEWRLNRTATAELTGLHELTMVVRAPRGHHVMGRVQISASIAGSRGLFRSRASLPDRQTTFACGT